MKTLTITLNNGEKLEFDFLTDREACLEIVNNWKGTGNKGIKHYKITTDILEL